MADKRAVVSTGRFPRWDSLSPLNAHRRPYSTGSQKLSRIQRNLSFSEKEKENCPKRYLINLHSVAQRYLPRQCRMFWQKLCLFGPKLLRKRDFCRCSTPLLIPLRILDRLLYDGEHQRVMMDRWQLIYVWNPARLSRRRRETSLRHRRGWKRGRDAVLVP